jgi:hypothetical protein
LWLALLSGVALALLTVGSMSAADVLREQVPSSPASEEASVKIT